ncbi:MAG TPA: 3-methyl-2-oxobutanoate hydroxymethyltransferase [Dehalococcoidia bacterium]|nr:3-methyl-2-oxobutanoate hydroxymethyltransferase [Dehalococcoidia bacterium]HCH07972.1 3-methyl-2-oxobutanoate hydroxymethyltransferase [Dehalococcoidia bacterium]HIM15851.1 3-methyl-2-oxobutanoate hydroxymethyltransferase [Dehalococcoidia bacterium]|tara:strand:- start:56 stop:904 length:849 start_codon:yes stop_codon:yes gene_type:complete
MRLTIKDLQDMKARGEKIPMMTAYDYTSGKLLEQAGIPLMLVGDSLGMVVLGYDSTVPVTMDDMLHHIKTVVRGTEKAHIVGDLPFMSYHAEVSEAIRNAGRILKEGGAQSVKLEGGQEMAETVNRIVKSGIPVMGHVGLTPQSVNQLGGYRVQGKTISDAIRLMEDTRALEEAGAYAVVLECVPAALAQMITDRLSIPTIGIGAGAGCDGQVQVLHDFLGLFTDFLPKHARRYANLAETIQDAASQYISDVHLGEFPTDKESYKMSQSVLDELAGKVFESA